MIVGALVLLQLMMSLRGAAVPPADSGCRQLLAKFVHWGLAATLLGQALTGAVAVYLTPQVSRVHNLLWDVLVVLLLLHGAGVLFHAIRGDGVFSRILPLWLLLRRLP